MSGQSATQTPAYKR